MNKEFHPWDVSSPLALYWWQTSSVVFVYFCTPTFAFGKWLLHKMCCVMFNKKYMLINIDADSIKLRELQTHKLNHVVALFTSPRHINKKNEISVPPRGHLFLICFKISLYLDLLYQYVTIHVSCVKS